MTDVLQFYPQHQYPVFIKCDLKQFDPNLSTILKECGFEKRDVTQGEKKSLEDLERQKHGRLLHIKLATAKVGHQIGAGIEGDRFGQESITPGLGFKIYRYKGHGLMIFSQDHCEWELGVLPNFGHPESKSCWKTILGRYLSLALAPFGVVGLWGHIGDNQEILIGRPAEANFENLFIDVKKGLLFYSGKEEKIHRTLTLSRLEPLQNEERMRMSKEELLSFLLARCSYFDYGGPNHYIRQSMMALCQISQGVKCSDRKFPQRTGLSY